MTAILWPEIQLLQVGVFLLILVATDEGRLKSFLNGTG